MLKHILAHYERTEPQARPRQLQAFQSASAAGLGRLQPAAGRTAPGWPRRHAAAQPCTDRQRCVQLQSARNPVLLQGPPRFVRDGPRIACPCCLRSYAVQIVCGFGVTREQADALLAPHTAGTFLLRFGSQVRCCWGPARPSWRGVLWGRVPDAALATPLPAVGVL